MDSVNTTSIPKHVQKIVQHFYEDSKGLSVVNYYCKNSFSGVCLLFQIIKNTQKQ